MAGVVACGYKNCYLHTIFYLNQSYDLLNIKTRIKQKNVQAIVLNKFEFFFQTALNSLMNTIKFILVILLPEVETFGWLIIFSFTFISIGSVLYTVYVVNKRQARNDKNRTHEEDKNLDNHEAKEPLVA
jgi:hypothetical protein